MKPFEIIISNDKKYYDGSKWRSFNNIDNVLDKMIRFHLHKEGIKEYKLLSKPSFEYNKNKFSVETEKIDYEFILSIQKSEIEQKQAANYFEGILQIRGENANSVEEVRNYVDKLFEKDKDRVFYSKYDKLKTGFDMRVSDKNYLTSLSNKILNSFGGISKISKKLFTRDRQSQKEVYRVTALVHLPNFQKGDAILYENKLVIIKSLSKNSWGLNLKTGKKVMIKNMNDIEIIKKYKVEISKTKPVIEVIHPTTFQSEPILNHKLIKLDNNKLEVIDHHGLFGTSV